MNEPPLEPLYPVFPLFAVPVFFVGVSSKQFYCVQKLHLTLPCFFKYSDPVAWFYNVVQVTGWDRTLDVDLGTYPRCIIQGCWSCFIAYFT